MTVGAATQLAGCNTTPSDRDRVVVADDHALERFVEGAVFYVRQDDGVWPVAPRAPELLIDYVVSHYDRDAFVRRLVVEYFLLYDRALIRRGLIDDDSSDGSLIRVLWDKESSRNPVFKETPSTWAMLRHIGLHAEYFGLTARDRSMLAENERLHEEHLRRATKK